MKKLTISIDMDGTICSSRYPQMGVLMKGADIIRTWFKFHTVIINSCRSGKALDDAIEWLDYHDIPFHYINENSKERIEMYGGDTRKISADVYIDDRNAGGFRGWQPIIDYVKKLERQLPIIVCIVGESGAGKSYLARRIEEVYGHHLIESFTDRPSRGEGDDHTFLTPEQFSDIPECDKIASTVYGGYRYCCTKQYVWDRNVYLISEDGMLELMSNFGHVYDIRKIRVTCPEELRIKRAGIERVERDKGRYILKNNKFDVVLRTDRDYNVYSLEEILI